MKPMDSRPGQGANRSDSLCYREDLQRRPGCEDAVSYASYLRDRTLGRHHKALAVLFSDDPGSLIKRRVVVQRGETDARELVGQITDGLVLIALALHIQRPAADAGQEVLPSAGLLRRKFSDCFFLDLLTAPGRKRWFGHPNAIQLCSVRAGPHESGLACGIHTMNGKDVLGEIDSDGDNGGRGLPLPKKRVS